MSDSHLFSDEDEETLRQKKSLGCLIISLFDGGIIKKATHNALRVNFRL